MEEIDKIQQFLTVDEFGYGSGSGSGSGSGFGSGSGDGYGSGYGDGSGFGDGDGDGYGDGYGSGYGDGSGSGDGSGLGFGSGYGDGYGDGSGSGYGSGYGYGYGYGVEYIGKDKVYMVDDTPTLIYGVHGDYAIGGILRSDLTVAPCFIAKKGNFFAHGETLHEAFHAVNEKWSENRPLEERIADFNRKYPDRNVKVPASELFSWHHILTGSCLAGRKEFCREHGLDYENGEYTVNEFIGLTRNAYGGEAIREMEQSKNSGLPGMGRGGH